MPIRANRSLHALTVGIIVLALAVGVVTRLVTLTRLLEFSPDQARDGLRVMAMWAGDWPTLGQEVTPVWLGPTHGGEVGFRLPPLGYYGVLPFTAGSSDPRWQVVPNALCSFFTIPLIASFVYQLLEGCAPVRRRLLTAIAALWWSLSFSDIVLNNKEWNPSAIPFFFFALVLLYAQAIRPRRADGVRFALWAGYGAVAAYLSALHASTLAIIPPVFLASLIAFAWTQRATPRVWRWPALALLIACACAAPYWIGEAGRGWSNTRAIVRAAVTHAPDAPPLTPAVRFKDVVLTYTQLGPQAYFVRSSHLWRVGLPFLIVVFCGFACFRGSRTMWRYLCATWLLFALAASGEAPNGAVFPHYKLLIIAAPLLLSLSVLAYLDGKVWWQRTLTIVVGAGLAVSLAFNARIDLDFLAEKFGSHRVLAASDMAQAFRRLPAGAAVCVNGEATWTSALYLDRLETLRSLRFVSPCPGGTYVIRARYVGRAMSDLADFGPAGADFQSIPNPDSLAGLRRVGGGSTYDIMQVAPRHEYRLVQGIRVVPASTAACLARVMRRRPPAPILAPPVAVGSPAPERAERGRTAQQILATLDYGCF